MKIAIANDHRAVDLKNYLIENIDKSIINYGTNDSNPVDYPLYAFKIGEAIKNKEIDMGILICGTGIGMDIACNKVKKVRCAKISNVEEAKLARLHNDANVIAISSKLKKEEALEIVKTFITTKFSEEERHKRRIELIDNYIK